MDINQLADEGRNLADKAADDAHDAVRSVHRTADRALDHLADATQEAGRSTASALDGAASVIESAVDDDAPAASTRLRTWQMKNTVVDYVQNDPVNAILIAAGIGAALMAVIAIVNRSRD